MVRYGRILLQNQPEATTELLIDLCSGNLGRKPTHVHPPAQAEGEQKTSSGPAMLSYLGYNRMTGFLTGETPAPNGTKPSPVDQPDTAEAPNGSSAPPVNEAPSYTPPSPQRYFAHFLDQPVMFIHFLESVALSLWKQNVTTTPQSRDTPLAIREEAPPSYDDDPVMADQRAVWNTLLELYLATTRSDDPRTARDARNKALGLLANTDLPYDPMHALILCSCADFKEGLVRLWESMGMYEDVLRFYIDKDQTLRAGRGSVSTAARQDEATPSAEVIRYLGLYGPTNPHLYPLVLRYLSSSPDVLSHHPVELTSILQTIDEERIMPPLAVVQLLSRNGVTSVGSVKEWLRQKTKDTRDDISAVSSLHLLYYTTANATGQELDRVVSLRDGCKGKANQGSVRYDSPRGLPSHALCGVWWSVGSAQCALHVQTFVPSEVCTVAKIRRPS